MARQSNIVRIVGNDSYEKLRSTKCLLVGAGGIGSELLKDLILMEFGEIHIVDLDTIDLSNLNRQFLFRQRDIKQPKSTTAVKAVQHFNNSKLVPYQGNIMDSTQFPLHWFGQFDVIFNALDNLAARRYVNKMSQFLSTPLLESGTAGFDGYIQPIIPGKTECFDCTKKETPKTFPVCTIRSTPSQPIHCIVWAKNFLFNQLFNAETNPNLNEEDEEENKDWGTTDLDEINRIRQETNELQELQNIVVSQQENRIHEIIEKLFVHDINKLLLIENLWKTRTEPTPLDITNIQNVSDEPSKKLNLSEIWTINDQVQQLVHVTKKLMKRMPKEQNHIEFDKDDQDTLEFVATTANIRSHIFNIPIKSVFDIKQIAGNIIPAIATTNAIVAGLSSLISLRVLNLLKYAPIKSPTDLNMAFTAKASNLSTNRYLSNPKLAPSSCNCPVCSKVVRGVVSVSSTKYASLTLQNLVDLIKDKYEYTDEISVLDTKNQRLLADFDFDDLLNKTLNDINLTDGTVIMFTDEDEDENGLCHKPLELYLDITETLPTGLDIRLPELEIPLVKAITSEEATAEEEEELSVEKNLTEENIIVLDEEEPSTKKRKIELEDEQAAKKTKSEVEDVIELD
ncbi:hypothetical protein KAFR_0E03620 [Kazachstania africana CBS 2517]|uniref:Ubiquitin-activating enzyme E1-like n=1 Tax=Kazachstania africana (strain ATCC 22294 / BCRC 22015 / CBS 2517 / CECT 1963 / NBRC 1671 / NRRL Y-8276) TaxID=1071382 RepID=H2AVW3_KAZAF|nr:hypothetical protein KAFR_0E03620 [Kazachstania africana CBS 2517]CCF58513.1 hypothetical protein KAFR_0E03620 [Kazachstania africana CBS 2517]